MCSRKPVSRPPTSSVQSLLPSLFPPLPAKNSFFSLACVPSSRIYLPSFLRSLPKDFFIHPSRPDRRPTLFPPPPRKRKRKEKCSDNCVFFLLFFGCQPKQLPKKGGPSSTCRNAKGVFPPFHPRRKKGGGKKGQCQQFPSSKLSKREKVAKISQHSYFYLKSQAVCFVGALLLILLLCT